MKYDLFDEAGWTQFSFYFMTRKVHTYFTEISRVIALKAMKRIKHAGLSNYAHIVIGDFRKLPFKNDTFDITCSLDSITYVPQWKKCLFEQVRVTKQGGRAIIMVPNIHNVFLGHFFLFVFDRIGILQRESCYSIPLARKELEIAGKDAGLEIIDLSGFSLVMPQLSWFDRVSEKYRNSKNKFVVSLLNVKSLIFQMLEEFFYCIEQKQTALNLVATLIVMNGQKRMADEICGHVS